MSNGSVEEKRTHRRYLVEGVNGNMLFASEVNILNLSEGGVAVESDKRMNMGAEYALKLNDGEDNFAIKGTVVWSSITHAWHTGNGETIPIYHAGLQFRRLNTDVSRRLHEFIEKHKLAARRRLSGLRFIVSHNHALLDYPFQYKVKSLSVGGMLIQCNQPLTENELYTMEIFLDNHVPVSFTGRIASCLAREDGGMKYFNVGIEFIDMSDKGKINIEEYIKVLESEGEIPPPGSD